MKIFTIGFTKISAESFFDRLRKAGVKKVIDVRLNNVSQLAGFTKKNDLQYFLREITHIPYEHRIELAPTQDMLDGYKKYGGKWVDYEAKFLKLLSYRKIENTSKSAFEDACLLCSEEKPHHCHRRLVAEYLAFNWGETDIKHL